MRRWLVLGGMLVSAAAFAVGCEDAETDGGTFPIVFDAGRFDFEGGTGPSAPSGPAEDAGNDGDAHAGISDAGQEDAGDDGGTLADGGDDAGACDGGVILTNNRVSRCVIVDPTR